jgi:hypothetical protein
MANNHLRKAIEFWRLEKLSWSVIGRVVAGAE